MQLSLSVTGADGLHIELFLCLKMDMELSKQLALEGTVFYITSKYVKSRCHIILGDAVRSRKLLLSCSLSMH